MKQQDLESTMNALLGITPSSVDVLLAQKTASAEPGLLSAAVALRPEDPLSVYEELGGVYQEKARD